MRVVIGMYGGTTFNKNGENYDITIGAIGVAGCGYTSMFPPART